MIGENELQTLRSNVAKALSEKRFMHSLGVKRAAIEIGKHCLPSKLNELSAAALLHDIAKELPKEEQLYAMRRCGYELTDEDYSSEALYHSFAAPYIIKERYASFATDDILSSVFMHTSGGDSMTVFDEIIFIADNSIEQSAHINSIIHKLNKEG